MTVDDFVKEGLKCPSCGSDKLRSGYHEWTIWDSWICKDCGFRWMEDLPRENYSERLMVKLKEEKEHHSTIRNMNTRLIWVLHVANKPDKPLKNPESSDECYYIDFIKGKRK